jgi:hypothetical protein
MKTRGAPPSAVLGDASNRRYRRVPASGIHITLSAGKEHTRALLVNVSVGGAAIICDEIAGQVDETLDVSLLDATDDSTARLDCRIRYVIGETANQLIARPKWLHGVQFIDPSAPSCTFLAKHVNSSTRTGQN